MIDFSNAKNIVIPEGEVSVIARGAEILWQKPTTKYKEELAYIEGTGAQWIDTGFIPNQDTRVLTEHSYTKQPANRGFIYGAGISATSRAFEMYTWGSNWNSPYGNNNIVMSMSSSFLIGGKITIDKNKNNIIIQYADGTSQINSTTYVAFDAPRNMWLFAINRGNASADLRADCVRLYCCKIWDSENLVRDFIPVLDWNNRPCMYDKVTDELFYNNGTGEFLYA